MIKTTLVAMTLLGCDCDGKVCEFVSETPPQWASVSDCEAAMKSRIVRRSDLAYPLVSGTCRVVNAETSPSAPAPEIVEAAATPPADAGANASYSGGLYSNVVEGSRLIFRKTGDGYAVVSSTLSATADGAFDLLRRSAALMLPE